jgi:hypothetical protein
VRGHPRNARAIECGAGCSAPLCARGEVRIAVQVQTARISAPLLLELTPGQRLRLGGSGGFLRGGQLCGGGLAVDDGQVVFGLLLGAWSAATMP